MPRRKRDETDTTTTASTAEEPRKSRSRSRSKTRSAEQKTGAAPPDPASTSHSGGGGGGGGRSAGKGSRKRKATSEETAVDLTQQTQAGSSAASASSSQTAAQALPLAGKGKQKKVAKQKKSQAKAASATPKPLPAAPVIDARSIPPLPQPTTSTTKKPAKKAAGKRKAQSASVDLSKAKSTAAKGRGGGKNKLPSSAPGALAGLVVVGCAAPINLNPRVSLPGPSSAQDSLEPQVPSKKRCLRSGPFDRAVVDLSGSTVSAVSGEPSSKKTRNASAENKKKKSESPARPKRSSRKKKTGSCASTSGRQTSATTSRQVTVTTSLPVPRVQSSLASMERESTPKPSTSQGQQSSTEASVSSEGGGSGTNSSSAGLSGSGSGARPREDPSALPLPSDVASLIPPGSGADNEGDESDMGRLQALLEARGLPSHLFGALGPRMHQLLHRTMSGGTMGKVQQLLQGLQATGDEDAQLTAAMEICQLLVMGTEDSLMGFPVKQVVPALIGLLQMEHNFDIMNNACRALTYMMESLPRSSAVVVDAVPTFLQKLEKIQCMDVAEQALTALEMLSKRHSKAILQYNGIAACLMYIDFFSVVAQRSALMVTANCVQNMTHEEFKAMSESLPVLSGRLSHSDKKSVESVCLCFSRLVDNFQNDQRVLKEISVHGLLTNVQQLVMISPPVISTSVFVMVIRMLAIMCASCPDLAVLLLKQKIAETLCFLLTGSSEQQNGGNIELVSRTPQELYELVCLIGELLPKLPSDGVFEIDSMLRKGPNLHTEAVSWQWQDDRTIWHNYTPIDSKIIEAAYTNGEDEICLSASGRSYSVDFNNMQQINEDTGTARNVQRKLNPLAGSSQHASASSGTDDPNVERCDSRAEILKEDYELASNFIQTLFAVLYEVYSSSAGPNIRHKCLQTLLRMIYYASPDLLRQVLKTQPVSSHIAAMMASPDMRVQVGAFQMADILMQKLPDIFSIYFRREGVMHQVKNIIQTLNQTTPSPSLHHPPPPPASSSSVVPSTNMTPTPSSPSPTTTTSSSSGSGGVKGAPSLGDASLSTPLNMTAATPSASSSSHSLDSYEQRRDADNSSSTSLLTGATPQADQPTSSAHVRLSDMLKRKRPPKRGPTRKGKGEESSTDPSGKNTTPTGRASMGRAKSASGKEPKSSGSGSKMSSFLPNLNPRSWARLGGSSDRHSQAKVSYLKQDLLPHKPPVNQNAVNKEKVRSWIKEQATRFLDKYFPASSTSAHPAHGVLNQLSQACQALANQENTGVESLQTIARVMQESDVSPFEVIHSGLIKGLLTHLTSQNSLVDRDVRLRQFLNVFLSCPPAETSYLKEQPCSQTAPRITYLLTKLMGCLHQQEQFQVKVHDLPGAGSASGRGGNALKFFSTHQLKCQLQRHPSCSTLKQWKGGPVKIDPLALVQAIERYLVMRGYGHAKDGDDDISDDDNSDDEMEDSMAAMFISQGSVRHRLEFLIGERVLPYNMTVYQAIRQFTPTAEREPTDTDHDSDNPLGNTGIWIQTHTICYRPASDQDATTATSPKKTKSDSKGSRSSKKKDSGSPCPITVPILYTYLTDRLPGFVTVSDCSVDTIALLRVLHAVNRHWATLYDVSFCPKSMVSSVEFLSSKLTAKATRQLQDPLIIMTGNLPCWLNQIGNAAPFLFPFDTRQLLFFATAFDRDRAMMRLALQQDNAGDSNTHESERVAPRLDRRRKTVNRVDLMKQAEKVMDELGNSKALLEIGYENEVGTGLGPTLEFYALVSKELQRADLELWKGEQVQTPSHPESDSKVDYVHNPVGLFPAPLARNAKTAHVNKIKAKFKFLGKFMAKALMDSRMIDIPLSPVFYKWVLGQEHSVSSADLHHIDPVMARSFQQLEAILHMKKQIYASHAQTEESRQSALASLTLDGASIEDLDLYFVLPGTSIELKKGGKDIQVTLHNLHEYLPLVVHWSMVEGVSRQFEAFREGFESVFPMSTLQCFYPEELEWLFCGQQWGQWEVRMLMEACRPDHGYTHDSAAIHNLYTVLASYDRQQQRNFLQFVTGSPRLPVGGFRSLQPPLTIVRKTFEAGENADDFLPSVMTCVNYLKLPEYSSLEVMRLKLDLASKEGQLSFHLS